MAMKKLSSSSWRICFYLAVTLLGNYSTVTGNYSTATEPEKKVYIVYLGDLPKGDISTSSIHNSMLEEVVGSTLAPSTLIYSYKRTFNGFVAKLTDGEAQKIKEMEGVVSVFPSRKKQLHTTRSWDYTGFTKSVRRTTIESDVIIGMLDTGIWPESESFSDEGFGPPPIKWKGSCTGLKNFTCNNKIIGAKYYISDGQIPAGDIDSPRDSDGHGTHTSSTAAGREVTEASLLGLATGTARGGVPSARIAVYKICWTGGCADADILAAFDDAIADGVDIISFSVGGSPTDYFEDAIAIGAFHSMKHGILTSNSAGNSGPEFLTISNFSPWSLSVAASTTDRKFVTKLALGNGQVYEGISINTFTLEDKEYPLIYGGDAPNKTLGINGSQSRSCYEGSLDRSLVAGKIVLCDGFYEGKGALSAGAVGTAMQGDGVLDFAYNFEFPVTYISSQDGNRVSRYIKAKRNATANIYKSVQAKDPLAPFVVSFSSRGPNPFTGDLLKPDLTAPGVEILAAWSQGTTVTRSVTDPRVVKFNIISGTSMSCPHATAAAAYVKSFHPTWSPAALKSALMTTATSMSTATTPDAELAYGSGQINPVKAVNPGLIYDAAAADYVSMLCVQGYNTRKLRLVTGDKSTCSEANNATVWDLNYPSFAFGATGSESIKVSFKRTVTNVGPPDSVYNATLTAPVGIRIGIVPSFLSFRRTGENQSFVVSVEGTFRGVVGSGSLVWDDGVHQARSPIVVYTRR